MCLCSGPWRRELRGSSAPKASPWNHWILHCLPRTPKQRDLKSKSVKLSLECHVLITSHQSVRYVVLNAFLRHSNRDTERNKEIAFLEAQVYEYVEILGVSLDVLMLLLELVFRAGFVRKPHVDMLRMWLQEQRQLTHENVQRKQARTGEEREEEEEEQVSESESEDEDNEIIYNPKNLPLGWDGKVKLQTHLHRVTVTASVTRMCEICMC